MAQLQSSESIIGLAPLLVVGILTICTAVVVYRLSLHPLSEYPGDLLAKISSWPNWYYAAHGNRHLELHRLHQKYGPVVRFGPNDISVNTATALQDIYGNRKANISKSDFYLAIQAAEGGPSTFSICDRTQHARKRRLLSQAFSENALRDMGPHIIEQVQKWCKLLTQGAKNGEWSEGRNMSVYSNYLSFDVLSDLCFGQSFGTLDNDENRYVITLVADAVESGTIIAYLPLKFLRYVLFQSPLAPIAGRKILQGQKRLMGFCQRAIARRRAAQDSSSTRDDFFHHLFLGRDPDTGLGYSPAELLPESILLVTAGSDTSSTCIAALFFYLVRTPRVLRRLTAEIRGALPAAAAITAKTVHESRLPYLRACIEETLRVAPPVPAHLPRCVLPGGAVVDGKVFPAGTVVGVSTYALHHSEEYFPDAFAFSPERWVVDPAAGVTAESVARAQSAFCPFSVGVRGCIGKNMAYMEISLAVAYVLWNFDVRVKPGDRTGEGAQGMGWGREREDEWQMHDSFTVKRDGPIVEFKARQL